MLLTRGNEAVTGVIWIGKTVTQDKYAYSQRNSDWRHQFSKYMNSKDLKPKIAIHTSKIKRKFPLDAFTYENHRTHKKCNTTRYVSEKLLRTSTTTYLCLYFRYYNNYYVCYLVFLTTFRKSYEWLINIRVLLMLVFVTVIWIISSLTSPIRSIMFKKVSSFHLSIKSFKFVYHGLYFRRDCPRYITLCGAIFCHCGLSKSAH